MSQILNTTQKRRRIPFLPLNHIRIYTQENGRVYVFSLFLLLQAYMVHSKGTRSYNFPPHIKSSNGSEGHATYLLSASATESPSLEHQCQLLLPGTQVLKANYGSF